jgi:hypothetical protein
LHERLVHCFADYVLFRDAIDFHMFKIVNGEVRLIQAVITGSGYTSTGWDDLDAGE